MKYYISDMGYELILADNRNISYEKHNHSTKNVLGFVIAGNVLVEDENGKREYRQGEYFIIPRYTVHFVLISKETTYLLNLCVEDVFLKEHTVLPASSLRNINEIFEQHNFDKNGISIIETGYQQLKSNYNSREEKCFGMVEEARKKVKENPEASLNIDLLSKMSQMSKYHFIRTFRNEVGLTPHNYQIQNRIRKAQKLLQHGTPLMDVALEMGFYDQSHFIKFFRKIVVIPKGGVEHEVNTGEEGLYLFAKFIPALL
ncbi:MAG: helix-turn-helix transcriptional regulator [Lachnospiraceae bacterium]|nr:helix-turn-helix transcriptional regulator [Lachnospiraceae bacterium]